MHAQQTKKISSVNDLVRLQQDLSRQRAGAKGGWITVSGGTCGLARGSDQLVAALAQAVKAAGLNIQIKVSGCLGFCEVEPIVIIHPGDIFYTRVAPQDAKAIVEETLRRGEVIDRLLYVDPATGAKSMREVDVPFYRHQTRLLLGSNRLIDPRSIEDYLAIGGYQALVKVLTTMSPEQVIETIKRSGLRGRGGGGFPTGVKWESCRKAEGDRKYIICNADEGDPGAFMDRSLIESNPHSMLEGMIIGAYAIGGHEGWVYIRKEYPLAGEVLRHAISQAREHNLLGKDILGTKLSFDIHIRRGAGAFVCGESTALMASLEGKVGEPRAKYVHTVEKGFWNRPSNLNNVETWANVPLIINRGVSWFTQIGTGDVTETPWGGSKGTKVF
jgi:NADH-quinone oxidoreductase subunit F